MQADARHIPLADESVQCVVTSPPYWGLRDYQVAGQIGLEGSIGEYVAAMVGVFREVWRVLRDDGTVWLNLGDSYAGASQCGAARSGEYVGDGGKAPPNVRNRNGLGTVAGLKPKDLCGIPWRVAFALQADGWYLRSDIIWAKPNPMPESVTDRPTRSHEYLFLLSKSERYFYDVDAIREPASAPAVSEARSGMRSSDLETFGLTRGKSNPSCSNPAGRNRRSVWTINSEPYPESHFATFPKKLVEPCILAGTPERGSCSACGTPWVRVTESKLIPQYASRHGGFAARGNADGMVDMSKSWTPGTKEMKTLGWRAQCRCNAPTRPALVFDPFLGSATVGEVCEALGRRWVGTELSMDYCKMGQRRTAQRGLYA